MLLPWRRWMGKKQRGDVEANGGERMKGEWESSKIKYALYVLDWQHSLGVGSGPFVKSACLGQYRNPKIWSTCSYPAYINWFNVWASACRKESQWLEDWNSRRKVFRICLAGKDPFPLPTPIWSLRSIINLLSSCLSSPISIIQNLNTSSWLLQQVPRIETSLVQAQCSQASQ
jgi:hypothetical protein